MNEYERDELGRWTGRYKKQSVVWHDLGFVKVSSDYGDQEELNAIAYERWVEDRNTEENDDDGK